ncbi:MAG: LapA family protein [Cyanobacteria bacterium J06621_8]
MRSLTNFLSSLLLAVLVLATAIFSIQNVENVSLKFLHLESISLPVGVMLIFCSGIGIILGWFIPFLFTRQKSRRG